MDRLTRRRVIAVTCYQARRVLRAVEPDSGRAVREFTGHRVDEKIRASRREHWPLGVHRLLLRHDLEKIDYWPVTVSQNGVAAAHAGSRRRWRLVGLGVIMSAVSILFLLAGIANPGRGLLVEIAGIITTLFFVPLTIFLLYAAVRLGLRDRRAASAGSQQ